MKEILPIMLVFTHTSINNGMFSQLAYDRSFISQKYEECRFLIDEMSMFNIHENEKNSVSWPVTIRKTDRGGFLAMHAWYSILLHYILGGGIKFLGNDQLASANESSNKFFMVVHSGITVVGMLKIKKQY